ncbi:inositol monophosphatase family protein [Lachnospiraceae bacterium 62-35]
MEIHMDRIMGILREAKTYFLDEANAHRITVKGLADYVTEVDKTVEEFLQKRLKEEYPQVQFMGEEKDNSDIDFSKAVWILDPVDGTTNLIHDYRHSAISLALCENDYLTAGFIYHPYGDEMYCAVRGKGAFLNGRPIHVSHAAALEESLIAFGTSPYQKELADINFRHIKETFLRCQDIRRSGSAAMDMAYVACGRIDAFYELTLKPWDYSAGLVLIEEAGGTVTDYKGHPIKTGKPSSVVAGNGKIGAILIKEVLK